MNTKYSHLIISMAAFFTAILFYLFYNQILIIRMPWNVTQIDSMASNIIQKKQVTHFYFHTDKWKTEKQDMLWADDIEKNILHLINAWLTLLDEEHITSKKISLQSVLITSAGHAYLSFDRTFFTKEETIFKKWMLIEGLLKTVKDNGIPITYVQFLVQHQILQDMHLDFSMPWSINGFLS